MQYVLVVVIDPKHEEKAAIQKISSILEKEGFSVSGTSSQGKKRLAYPLKKQAEGIYLSFILSGESVNPNHLYAKFKLEEYILRTLVLKKMVKKGDPKFEIPNPN